jgi:predicted metalloprotease with PDZ domain
VDAVIQHGEPALLPDDAFGECARVVTRDVPTFDRGFDLQATEKNGGRVTGLEPGGPAERAGLREGMRIRINESPSNDSQRPLTYLHKDADGTITRITYNPEGKAMIVLQQLELTAKATGERRAACTKEIAG